MTPVIAEPHSGQAVLPGISNRSRAQPFLKWVGGKTQLLPQFEPFLPLSINRYFEPFLGGGAVFFHLKARFPAMQAVLRDNNPELINIYKVVRDRVKDLMARLDEHLLKFKSGGDDYFYEVRGWHSLPQDQVVERAARMIFLNKTCFNGLWRVNARPAAVPLAAGAGVTLDVEASPGFVPALPVAGFTLPRVE